MANASNTASQPNTRIASETDKAIPGAPMSIQAGVNEQKPDSQQREGVSMTSKRGWEYKKVVFHPKRHKSDPETVKLKLTGVGLIFHRQVEVVCPVPYLKTVADAATEDQFDKMPDKGFKKRAPVKKYDYTVIADATEAEYLQRLRDGNKNAKKYRMTMQSQG
jgi:hypothetical protein